MCIKSGLRIALWTKKVWSHVTMYLVLDVRKTGKNPLKTSIWMVYTLLLLTIVTIEHVLLHSFGWKMDSCDCQMGLYPTWLLEAPICRSKFSGFFNDFFGFLWRYTKAPWWTLGWPCQKKRKTVANRGSPCCHVLSIWEANVTLGIKILTSSVSLK